MEQATTAQYTAGNIGKKIASHKIKECEARTLVGDCLTELSNFIAVAAHVDQEKESAADEDRAASARLCDARTICNDEEKHVAMWCEAVSLVNEQLEGLPRAPGWIASIRKKVASGVIKSVTANEGTAGNANAGKSDDDDEASKRTEEEHNDHEKGGKYGTKKQAAGQEADDAAVEHEVAMAAHRLQLQADERVFAAKLKSVDVQSLEAYLKVHTGGRAQDTEHTHGTHRRKQP